MHETQKKITSTPRYNNSSLIEGFKRFIIGSLCGLLLEAGQLDDLWFATT
jgi:hypothetical protein